MRIGGASDLDLDQLTRLWNLGYAGYFFPLEFTPTHLNNWIASCDIDLELSRVAYDDDPIGFLLVGRRGSRGWLGGFGVVEPQRSHGIGKALVVAALEAARAAGLKHLQLEALTENTAALRAYQGGGFTVSRELGIFRGHLKVGLEPAGTRTALQDLLPDLAGLHQGRLKPCWQREAPTLQRVSGEVLAVREGTEAAAVFRSAGAGSLTLLDLGMRADNARLDLIRLLARIAAEHPGAAALLLNEPLEGPIAPLLPELGLMQIASQYEMELAL